MRVGHGQRDIRVFVITLLLCLFVTPFALLVVASWDIALESFFGMPKVPLLGYSTLGGLAIKYIGNPYVVSVMFMFFVGLPYALTFGTWVYFLGFPRFSLVVGIALMIGLLLNYRQILALVKWSQDISFPILSMRLLDALEVAIVSSICWLVLRKLVVADK